METKGLTLREALSSGRKIRHPSRTNQNYFDPSEITMWTTESILANDWEIEPEKKMEPITFETRFVIVGTNVALENIPYGFWVFVKDKRLRVTVEEI